MKNLVLLGFLSAIFACSHPIEIVGEGDVLSATGTRNCYLEDFQAKKENCTKNIVLGEYIETYYAEARDGWQFDQWINYCADAVNNECAFSIPADAVKKNWGAKVPSLVAVFKQIPVEPPEPPAPKPTPVAIYSYNLDSDGRLINPLPLEGAKLQRRTVHFSFTGEYKKISFWCCKVPTGEEAHAPRVDDETLPYVLTLDLAALADDFWEQRELYADVFYADGSYTGTATSWTLEPKETEPYLYRMIMTGVIDSADDEFLFPIGTPYTAEMVYKSHGGTLSAPLCDSATLCQYLDFNAMCSMDVSFGNGLGFRVLDGMGQATVEDGNSDSFTMVWDDAAAYESTGGMDPIWLATFGVSASQGGVLFSPSLTYPVPDTGWDAGYIGVQYDIPATYDRLGVGGRMTTLSITPIGPASECPLR